MENIYQLMTPQEIDYFRKQGISDAEMQTTLNELNKQDQAQVSPLQQSYNSAMQNQQAYATIPTSPSMFSNQYQDNLVKWQLELDSLLERVDHMLRGDKPKMVNNNLVWTTPNDKERLLNDFGVAELMRTLSLYLNRNTILSNYDEKTINLKMLDFGSEVNNLIFLKYETMGLDTLEKRKLYGMLVREIVDAVHSAYLRALNGGERDSLREARQVMQNEQVNPSGITINTSNQARERSRLNPLRYVMGRYK